jgi:hypothetical protein
MKVVALIVDCARKLPDRELAILISDLQAVQATRTATAQRWVLAEHVHEEATV